MTRWLPRTAVRAWRKRSRVSPGRAGADRRRLPIPPREGQHQVLDRYVLVFEPPGLPFRGVKQARESLGDENLARGGSRSAQLGAAAQVGFDLGAQPIGVGTRLGEQPGDEPVRLIEEGEQEMLPVDLGVPEAQRNGLGFLQRFLGLLGQSVHVHGRPPVS